jgi:hypothetical protein
MTRQLVAALLCLAACKGRPSEPAAPPPGLSVTLQPVPFEPEPRTHVVQRRRFRHSSVRGDFRVLVGALGPIVSWKTEVSARDGDGKQVWRMLGYGRAMAVSPDRERVIVNDESGKVVVLEARTGVQPAVTSHLGARSWIWSFSWVSPRRWIGAFADTVYALDGNGELVRTLAPLHGKGFFSSVTALPGGEQALLCDTNGGRILRIDADSGAVVSSAAHQGASDAALTSDGKRFVVDGYDQIAMFDAASMAQKWIVPHPGASGVRFPDSAEHSSERWKPLPKPSPDGRVIAVNDQSGRLWLLSASDGKPLIAYPRTLVNFVEDFAWGGDSLLYVIDNAGRVIRLEGTPARVVWSVDDAPEPERWDSP